MEFFVERTVWYVKLEFAAMTSGEETVREMVGVYTDKVPMLSSSNRTFDS
jgi:hypothetical protein